MAVRVSYTKYKNNPKATFWSQMQTLMPIGIGLAGLFLAIGVSLGLGLKGFGMVLFAIADFVCCMFAAMKAMGFANRKENDAVEEYIAEKWNEDLLKQIKEKMREPGSEIPAEDAKSLPSVFLCKNCGKIHSMTLKEAVKCPTCGKPLYNLGVSPAGWNAASTEDRKARLQWVINSTNTNPFLRV